MFPNLRAEIARRNLSVAGLARLIGMKQTTMSDKYHGRSNFSLDDAIKIKEALGLDMSIEELFQKDEED